MPVVGNLRRKLLRLHYGIYTPTEIFLLAADTLAERLSGNNPHYYDRERVRRLLSPDENCYHVKDVRLPILDSESELALTRGVFEDTFCSYVFFGDRYDEEIVDTCDKFLPEGLYGLVNDKVNVTVEPDDIVIDAGSWIGDFAAYASVRGASVYAFEPSEKNFAYLEKTASLNKNITPVKKGLSDENTNVALFTNSESNRSYSMLNMTDNENFSVTSRVETTRLDDFVRDNNLQRVDFIKSDIEGFERHLLAGAQQTLRDYAPKLALCTYHLPDDPEVMAELILKANPKYNIVQKRKKLYASVPR